MKMKSVMFTVLGITLITVAGFAGGRQPAPQPSQTPQPQQTPQSQQTQQTTLGLGPDMLLLPSVQSMGDRWPGAWDNYGFTVRYILFSRLLRVDSAIEPVYGDLAQSWTTSPDGLTYTFTLKNNIKWHDGTPFSADDVAFSLKTAMKSPQVNAMVKTAISRIKGAAAFAADASKTAANDIEGIRVNGNVITITMDRASGTFLLAMSQFNILPRHKIEGLNPQQINTSVFYDHPIGTGPYRIKEFAPNDYTLLEAFDDYFGPKPQIKQIKVTQMTETDFATRALANDIDFFQTNDLATAQAALRNPNYKAFYTDIYFVRYFQWNSYGLGGNGDDPLKDIRVRRALLHAIDRQALLDSLMPNQATVINSKVPSSFDYANTGVYNLDYNPAKARQLLNEAGFDFSKTIRLATYYGDQTTADFMDAVVYYLNEAGVKAEWHLLSGDLGAQIYDIRDYHVMYAGLSAMAFEEAYDVFYSRTIETSVMGSIFPKGFTKMDPLIERLWVTVDPAQRKQIQLDIQKVETEDMLWHLPLFALRNIQVFNTARVNLPPELVLSNEWTNYERYIEKWTLNSAPVR
ncbi:MAG: ABC transporter substrate-binding protein [Treponema sp.]|nr:ABC transporter substrate-binding protein [Treponema sp.]